MPAPPYSSGTIMPSRPISPISRTISAGKAVLAVALRGAGPDALLGEAAHLVAQQLLVLAEGEVDAGARPGRARSARSPSVATQALLSTQSAITIFWISLVPS